MQCLVLNYLQGIFLHEAVHVELESVKDLFEMKLVLIQSSNLIENVTIFWEHDFIGSMMWYGVVWCWLSGQLSGCLVGCLVDETIENELLFELIVRELCNACRKC